MSTKTVLSALIIVVVLFFAWTVLNDKVNNESSVQQYEHAQPAGPEPDRSASPASVAAQEEYSEERDESGVRSGPTLVSPDAMASPGSGRLNESMLIPPEGMSGDTSSMGPAPEAGDTGIMGPAPEAGDTGVMGPAPEADAIIMENQAPEFGQSTEPGLPPEAPQTP